MFALRSQSRTRAWLRLALVPVTAAAVLAGIWVAGGLVTNDFQLAMLLTTAWVGAAGAAALWIAWRWRALALPVLGTVVVTAGTAGGYLLYTSSVDMVVDERVAVAVGQASAGPDAEEEGDTATPPAVNVALARGQFVSAEHETEGAATLIRLAAGGTVLTLTELDTDPGPDLRVYLVTGSADDFGDVVDLGALKGNKGNQQYDVPASATRRHRTVVIWCRAFSVAFGSARLA